MTDITEKTLTDGNGRPIRYMRVSVTDRCNLRCRYCVPSGGFVSLLHEQIISYEEIVRLATLVAPRGVGSIRITGGEPLVRRHLDRLIRSLSSIPAVEDISLTTNGILLGPLARPLREAGLTRVNVSLDTLREDRFSWITSTNGKGEPEGPRTVLKGMTLAEEAGLAPVKVNVVLMRGFNDDELEAFADLTRDRDREVRFIEFMPMSPQGFWGRDKVVTASEAIGRLETVHGPLERLGRGNGSGPAIRYRIPGFAGTLGFIAAVSDHFCGDCNRIRVTADGKLRTCLFSDNEADLLGPLRSGAPDDQLLALIEGALREKPEGHGIGSGEVRKACARTMSLIGG